MTMNVVAMNVLLVLFDTLGTVFKQQGLRRIDHVVDVRTSRHVAKTVTFGTRTFAIASKLPQLLLLTPKVHITTVYLPKLCAVGLSARRPYVGCILARRHCVNVLIGHVHTNAGLDNYGRVFFSLASLGLPFIEVKAGLQYTVGKMNFMSTVAYLNEIVLEGGGGVLS